IDLGDRPRSGSETGEIAVDVALREQPNGVDANRLLRMGVSEAPAATPGELFSVVATPLQPRRGVHRVPAAIAEHRLHPHHGLDVTAREKPDAVRRQLRRPTIGRRELAVASTAAVHETPVEK